MAKRKKIYERLEDRSATLESVDANKLALALGAEETGSVGRIGSAFSVWALRSRLLSDIVSTGGRPGRREASLRKIPLTDAEWAALDEVTQLLKHEGVSATPGQVAGLLLHQSLAEVLRRLDRVTPSPSVDATSAKQMTTEDLEETLESVFAAAASAKVHLDELRPVALELLRRMRDSQGAESDDK